MALKTQSYKYIISILIKTLKNYSQCLGLIEFKILLIVFKSFKGLAPSYLSFLSSPNPVSKYNLRSSSDSTLLSYSNVKPKATLGERAFLFAAPKLWNVLPRYIRESISVDTFKRKLKRLRQQMLSF